MSFSKSQRFDEKKSTQSTGSVGGGSKAASNAADKSRNSSSSRRESRPCSKDSGRSRSLGRGEDGRPRSTERPMNAVPIHMNFDEIPVGGGAAGGGNILNANDDNKSEMVGGKNVQDVQEETENKEKPIIDGSKTEIGGGVVGEKEIASNVSIKLSPSSTSKKGLSNIPIRTSSAPPKSPTKQATNTSPRFNSKPVVKPKNSQLSPERNATTKQTPRSLELEFVKKKKKFEELKRDLMDRQKPVVESYQNLVHLKKKLEEVGSEAVLDPMKFFLPEHETRLLQFQAKQITTTKMSEEKDKGDIIDENIKQEKAVPPVTLDSIKDSLKAIPRGIMETCKNLHQKRLEIIAAIESTSDAAILRKVADFKKESKNFEDELLKVMQNQEKQMGAFVNKWIAVIDRGLPQAIADNETLRKQIKEQDGTIMDLCRQVNDMNELQEKIRELEAALQTEKCHVQETKEKNATVDQKTRAMKLKMRDVENKTKEYEGKISDLQNHLQQAQTTMRNKERQWEKEKQELHKLRKQDQQVIERMTKDKTATESRLQAINDLLLEKEAENKKLVKDYEDKIKDVTKKWMDDKLARDELQSKNEFLQNEITRVEAANQEAIDVMRNRREVDEGIEPDKEDSSTLRERELYAELRATKVALKDAQEQLESLAVEKMRFIDSLDKLNESSEEGKKNLAKSMFKKDEEISTLSALLKEKNEIIDKLTLETKKFEAKVDFMQAKIGAMHITQEMDVSTTELKETINEGKMKLEYALKKSLDNEKKVIHYKNEIEKQQKNINEMENLLKVRDGLIGMIKMRKDELSEKNNSLTKYATELRELLFEAKDELKLKVQIISELTKTVAQYQAENLRLDKKVSELEAKLSNSNEKRYKLQDAIGNMEKELQNTKAQATHISELQSRYEPLDVRKCYSMPQRITPCRRYKHVYDKHQKKRVLAFKKYSKGKSVDCFFPIYPIDMPPCYGEYSSNSNNASNVNVNVKERQDEFFNVYSMPTDSSSYNVIRDKEFLKNMRKLLRYDKKNERTRILGNPQENLSSSFMCDSSKNSKSSTNGNSLAVCKLTHHTTIHHHHHKYEPPSSILDSDCDKLRKSIDDSLHMIEEKILKAKTSF